MENEIRTLIDAGKSQRQISVELKIPQTSLRRKLKKLGLQTRYRERKIVNGKKECSKCGIEKSLDDFYKRSDAKHLPTSKCKKCSNSYYSERVKNVKIRMINYKGGSCEKCRLKLSNTHYSVFDFHHKDPSEKDVNFDRIKYRKWELIEKEIDKCMLLCSNCHRIIHAELGGYL